MGVALRSCLYFFLDLSVSKWEVGLRTAFWMLSEWIKDPKTVAGCAETIVNIQVFVRSHLFIKSVIFLILRWLWESFWEVLVAFGVNFVIFRGLKRLEF